MNFQVQGRGTLKKETQDETNPNAHSFNEIQPASDDSPNTPQTYHTFVTISEDDTSSEKKEGCGCKEVWYVCKKVYKFLPPFFGISYVCLAGVVVAVSLGLVICCSIIASTASLPLLVLSYLVIRLLQFFARGDSYEKAIQVKLFIRTMLLLDMVIILVLLWIFYPVTKYFTGLKNVMLMGLTLSNWVRIYYVIFAIYVLSCAVSVVTLRILLPLLRLEESGLNVAESVLEIIDCLIFWVAESQVFMKRVSTFKHHMILGLHTHKWIEVSVLILVAYNVITLSTHMIVCLLKRLASTQLLEPGTDKKSLQYLIVEKLLRKKYVVYWARGMCSSINFILTSLLLLISWVSFFGSNLDKTPQTKTILKFGTSTCVSLLICSLLWLIKTCVLLSWEAHSVYNRLDSKILKVGRELYFLGVIGRHNYDILNILFEYKHNNTCWNITLFCYLTIKDDVDEWGDDDVYNLKYLLRKKKKNTRHELLMIKDRIPSLNCIQQVAGYFLTAKNTLLSEDYICDIINNLNTHSQDDNRSIEEILRRLIQFESNKDAYPHDLEHFVYIMREHVGSSAKVSLRNVRIWIERARNNCLCLSNTLSSAKEVVDCLNKIISWLLIVASFIMWLLLTGLATTRVLVLIASPLLAATFIFGDACKTLFQGIMFAYMVHPFDVGDLCVIDGNMIEVKTVGVWKTTFAKVGNHELLIYPNSELSNKNIINYKTDFDWNSCVELDVASLGDRNVKTLKQEIEKHLDGNPNKFTPGYNCVEVLTTGYDIKVVVNFRHNVNLKHSTYFECLKEKRKRQSKFVLHLQTLVDRRKIGESKISDKHEEKMETQKDNMVNDPSSRSVDVMVVGKAHQQMECKVEESFGNHF